MDCLLNTLASQIHVSDCVCERAKYDNYIWNGCVALEPLSLIQMSHKLTQNMKIMSSEIKSQAHTHAHIICMNDRSKDIEKTDLFINIAMVLCASAYGCAYTRSPNVSFTIDFHANEWIQTIRISIHTMAARKINLLSLNNLRKKRLEKNARTNWKVWTK